MRLKEKRNSTKKLYQGISSVDQIHETYPKPHEIERTDELNWDEGYDGQPQFDKKKNSMKIRLPRKNNSGILLPAQLKAQIEENKQLTKLTMQNG